MAEMRSEVPRHAEDGRKMQMRPFFASRQAVLLLAGIDSADDLSVWKEAKGERKQSGGGGELTQRTVTYPTLVSAGGESWTRKEAEEEAGKRSEMAEMRSELPRHAEERGKMVQQRRGNENFASKEAALLPAGMDSADGQSVRKDSKEETGKISEMQYEWEKRSEESEASYRNRLRLMPNEDTDTSRRQRETNSKEKARTTPKVEAKDAEEEAGKAEESVTVGSGKTAMNQDVTGIMTGIVGYSFIHDEAEKEERRVVLKDVQEKMARTKELPTKGLEEDSNRKTEPAADPNSTTIQDDHGEPSITEALAKTAADEINAYLSYRKSWESHCCGDHCDHFDQRTTLSSMQYAHRMPEMDPISYAQTLQVFSMKLKFTEGNAGDFKLPLYVYGSISVRDILDSRRNILFSCNRTVAQKLTEDDPFLHFTGPSRAIMSEGVVYFQIHLKVKTASGSQDKHLITCARCYGGRSNTALCFNNVMCTLEVCLRTVKKAVQATIMCVQIVNKHKLGRPSNFAYGGRVACIPLPTTTDIDDGDQKIVLVESKGGEFPQGCFGYVHLRSQVVSVEIGGELAVVIQAYDKSGAVAEERCIRFKAQNCQVSQKFCFVGQAKVNVTVAWSDVPTDRTDMVYGY